MTDYTFIINNQEVCVTLERRNGSTHSLIFDLDKWHKIKQYPLNVSKSGKLFYVHIYDRHKNTNHLIHRVLLKATNGLLVDHINGNTLDNRMSNLRLCSKYENRQNIHHLADSNCSGVLGVFYTEGIKHWRIDITLQGKRTYLGRYETIKEAEQVAKEFRANHMPFSKEARELSNIQ
jgi:hypothetical protein